MKGGLGFANLIKGLAMQMSPVSKSDSIDEQEGGPDKEHLKIDRRGSEKASINFDGSQSYDNNQPSVNSGLADEASVDNKLSQQVNILKDGMFDNGPLPAFRNQDEENKDENEHGEEH